MPGFLHASSYWIARLILQRGLGCVYLFAFLVALEQFRPLLGEHGLLPARPPRPLLPPPAAADAAPALVVFPRAAEPSAPHRGPGQPFRPAGGARPALLPAADRGLCRRSHGDDAAVAGLERKLRLAEL